nr:hypothetical protein CFP56_00434 [Quercus suber]
MKIIDDILLSSAKHQKNKNVAVAAEEQVVEGLFIPFLSMSPSSSHHRMAIAHIISCIDYLSHKPGLESDKEYTTSRHLQTKHQQQQMQPLRLQPLFGGCSHDQNRTAVARTCSRQTRADRRLRRAVLAVVCHIRDGLDILGRSGVNSCDCGRRVPGCGGRIPGRRLIPSLASNGACAGLTLRAASDDAVRPSAVVIRGTAAAEYDCQYGLRAALRGGNLYKSASEIELQLTGWSAGHCAGTAAVPVLDPAGQTCTAPEKYLVRLTEPNLTVPPMTRSRPQQLRCQLQWTVDGYIIIVSRELKLNRDPPIGFGRVCISFLSCHLHVISRCLRDVCHQLFSVDLNSWILAAHSKFVEPCRPQCHDMPYSTALPLCPIYSKKYFSSAATWWAWNRLTIRHVHSLRSIPGFEGQNIFFHLNWPIQYVRLVGLVVDIELAPNCEGRYTLLTLDDGSGACIVVKITRRRVWPGDDSVYPSNTTCDHVDVHVLLGLPSVRILGQAISIGDVIRVKGTISTFRHVRQIELKLAAVVRDTNEEASAWRETVAWSREKLARPWVLTQKDRDAVDAEERQKSLALRERAAKRRDIGVKLAEKQRRKDEKHEAQRSCLTDAVGGLWTVMKDVEHVVVIKRDGIIVPPQWCTTICLGWNNARADRVTSALFSPQSSTVGHVMNTGLTKGNGELDEIDLLFSNFIRHQFICSKPLKLISVVPHVRIRNYSTPPMAELHGDTQVS